MSINKDRIKEYIIAAWVIERSGCVGLKDCATYLGVHRNTAINRINSGQIIDFGDAGKHSIPMGQFLDRLIELALEELDENPEKLIALSDLERFIQNKSA